jgi:hypothetical protein
VSFADSLRDFDGTAAEGQLATDLFAGLEETELNGHPNVVWLVITPGSVLKVVARWCWSSLLPPLLALRIEP